MQFLKRIYRNKPVFDAIILLLIATFFLSWAISVDAFELLVDFVEDHEAWDLDEYVLAVALAGLTGFIYAIRRAFEARAEIKKRNAAERDVDWIANHDTLTKLPNRNYLTAFAERIDDNSKAAENKKFFVAIIDLDGFKKINDTLGPKDADEVLVAIADRLEDEAPHDLVVRMEGDEFVVVAAQRPHDTAILLGQRLLTTISQPLKVKGMTIQVNASIGVSSFPEDAPTLGKVIRRADIAMSAAQKNGRNCVVAFKATMKSALNQRTEIEDALRAAIQKNEIITVYQPLVDLKTRNLKGFESLARWTKNNVHPVPPSVFIGMAEELGLITDLSENLLRRACKDAKNWPSDLMLSFNISPTQLTDKLMGQRILQVLEELSFPAHRLEIEITENSLIRDARIAVRILDDLRSAGVMVAIDDFGTGYSSLSQLSKFQFDRIKIDQSFVASFESDERQRNIVKAIVGLAKGLGISTTAEGIENVNQFEILKDFGCNYGQGYLLGKGVPGDKVNTLITKMTNANQPQRRTNTSS